MMRQTRWIFVIAGPTIVERRSDILREEFHQLFPNLNLPGSQLDDSDQRIDELIEAIAKEFEPLVASLPAVKENIIRGHEEELLQLKRRSSLELHSLLNQWASPRDRLFILSRDSISGIFYAHALANVCRKIFNWPRTEVVPLAGFVETDYVRFRNLGVSSLTREIDRRIRSATQTAEIIFDVTGCHRELLPIITILGMLFRATVSEFDEKSEMNRLLPPLPLELNQRWFQNPFYQVLNTALMNRRRITRGQLMQKGLVELLPLFDAEGNELHLSPAGRLVAEVIRIRMRRENWRERF